MEQLSKFNSYFANTIQKINNLSQVKSNGGKSCALIRLLLNEHKIEDAFSLLNYNNEITNLFYNEFAFLSEHENKAFVQSLLLSISPVNFNLNVDDLQLEFKNNTSSPISRSADNPTNASVVKKKVPTIILFFYKM